MPEAMPLVAKAVVEFLGTFFLCLTISLTKTSSVAALAIGLTLTVCIYSGAHVSGAQYNPAVTLALLIRGAPNFSPVEALVYVVVQSMGSICAAATSWVLLGGKQLAAFPAFGPGVGVGAAFLAEATLTFALCSVVLHVATSKAQANNSYYGLAIGGIVLSGAVSVGRVSGGAFNPAVGLLPLFYIGAAKEVGVYFAGPLLGAILAGLLFRVTNVNDYENPPSFVKNLAPAAAPIIEFVGTTLLVFTVGTATGKGGDSPLTTLSIGTILMSLIYMGASISGAQYNPAVTLSILERSFERPTGDNFKASTALMYWFAQLIAGIVGTFLAVGVLEGYENVGYPALPTSSNIGRGLLGEFLGTFALAYIVLNVATAAALAGNSFFGIAIGQTITVMATAIGPISGGAFNPAVGMMGPVLSIGGRGNIADSWIYWVGPLLGGALSAIVFRVTNREEFNVPKMVAKFMANVSDEVSKPVYVSHHGATDPDTKAVAGNSDDQALLGA